MKVDLSSLLDKTKNFLQFEGNKDLHGFDFVGRDINIVSPIKYKGNVYRVDGQLELDIELSYSYEEECHRCLKPTTHQVKSQVSGKLLRKIEEVSEDEGLEENFYFEDDYLEIEDYILNQVIVSLPMKSLCNPNCKGLCSKCGADLNNNKCNCVKEDIDPRFEKLKDFFPEN